MTPYDPATEGETGRRPAAAELFAGRRRLPSRTRSRRLRRGLEQPVGARDARPSTRSTATSATSKLATSSGYGRRAAPTPTPTTSGSSSTSPSTRTSPSSSTGTRPSCPDRSDPSFPVVPDVDLLVGGFPCQDYSVAKTLSQAHGLVGKKGVLWWEIHRLLRLKLEAGADPPPLPRERRPAPQVADRAARSRLRGDARVARRPRLRGRVARRQCRGLRLPAEAPARLHRRSPRAAERAARGPAAAHGRPGSRAARSDARRDVRLGADRARPRRQGGQRHVRRSAVGRRRSGTPASCGSATSGGAAVWTLDVEPACDGSADASATSSRPTRTCRSSSSSTARTCAKWEFLKGAKSLTRISRATGLEYTYDEGPIPFPDRTDGPRGRS